ncbi:ROK family protein [Leifsonia sp. NPDC058230]|uniref:ROK family protein n=1 Tax=Leifsonia sp. NPDC058230 TaxID=3346391 RepID=UPI0036DE22B7
MTSSTPATPEADATVGIDIGGTKIAAAVVDRRGRLSHRSEVSTPASEGPDAILDAAAELASRVAAAAGIRPNRFGVGSAGAFDERGRVVHATDHLTGWAGTDAAAGLERRLDAHAIVVNDVHAAALGELWSGGAADLHRFLFVAVGTGIGGAAVTGSRVVRGASGMAGSVGHVRIVSPRRRVCSCGGIDHVEAFASGPGIERTYLEFTGRSRGLRDIARLGRDGDVVAAEVIRRAAEELGESLAAAVTLFDAGVVVLGGGVSGVGELFTAPLASRLRAELPSPFSTVAVRPAILGGDAALLGAGGLALRVDAGEPYSSFFV